MTSPWPELSEVLFQVTLPNCFRASPRTINEHEHEAFVRMNIDNYFFKFASKRRTYAGSSTPSFEIHQSFQICGTHIGHRPPIEPSPVPVDNIITVPRK
jgi:hypothetical protein